MRIVLATLARISFGGASAGREMRLLSLGAMIHGRQPRGPAARRQKRKNDEEDL
ncbi:hypothetical protein X729_25645 [Mesorhizobium sp. L103C131B0]|jgi:hypothetical protein|nr:hypothetical protein X729_25645 [Mesorhizobium sp. L103C131B0]